MFAVEVECLSEEVLATIDSMTTVVSFSLDSSYAGDAIFSFVADICSEASKEAKPSKHAFAFGNFGRLQNQIHGERVAALDAFHSEIR